MSDQSRSQFTYKVWLLDQPRGRFQYRCSSAPNSWTVTLERTRLSPFRQIAQQQNHSLFFSFLFFFKLFYWCSKSQSLVTVLILLRQEGSKKRRKNKTVQGSLTIDCVRRFLGILLRSNETGRTRDKNANSIELFSLFK